MKAAGTCVDVWAFHVVFNNFKECFRIHRWNSYAKRKKQLSVDEWKAAHQRGEVVSYGVMQRDLQANVGVWMNSLALLSILNARGVIAVTFSMDNFVTGGLLNAKALDRGDQGAGSASGSAAGVAGAASGAASGAAGAASSAASAASAKKGKERRTGAQKQKWSHVNTLHFYQSRIYCSPAGCL